MAMQGGRRFMDFSRSIPALTKLSSAARVRSFSGMSKQEDGINKSWYVIPYGIAAAIVIQTLYIRRKLDKKLDQLDKKVQKIHDMVVVSNPPSKGMD